MKIKKEEEEEEQKRDRWNKKNKSKEWGRWRERGEREGEEVERNWKKEREREKEKNTGLHDFFLTAIDGFMLFTISMTKSCQIRGIDRMIPLRPWVVTFWHKFKKKRLTNFVIRRHFAARDSTYLKYLLCFTR